MKEICPLPLEPPVSTQKTNSACQQLANKSCKCDSSGSPAYATLEAESGNDASPNSLKKQLATALDGEMGAENLVEKVALELDVERLDMPSFNAFKTRLIECANRASSA